MPNAWLAYSVVLPLSASVATGVCCRPRLHSAHCASVRTCGQHSHEETVEQPAQARTVGSVSHAGSRSPPNPSDSRHIFPMSSRRSRGTRRCCHGCGPRGVNTCRHRRRRRRHRRRRRCCRRHCCGGLPSAATTMTTTTLRVAVVAVVGACCLSLSGFVAVAVCRVGRVGQGEGPATQRRRPDGTDSTDGPTAATPARQHR